MTRLVKLSLVLGLSLALVGGVSEAGPRRGVTLLRGEHRTACGWVARASPESKVLPLVWVVDGAGDLKGCTNALTYANDLSGGPFELAAFGWSHGYRRLVLDQTDWAHSKAQGERLAAAILARKKQTPEQRVVVVAHSAGCAVALAAADHLPPNAIDRTILLAPSVSSGYDLRPALTASREGLDVFCSHKDRLALGFAVRVVGMADAGSGPAAGQRGFQARLDPVLGAKLRQHHWSAEVAWTGHTGGHHGMFAPAFVRSYLFPLFG